MYSRSNNWPFIRNKFLRQQVHKTLIHYLWSIMTTYLSWHSKCTHSIQVNHHLVPWIGTPWDFSVILSVVPTTIGYLFHFGKSGFPLLSVCQFRNSLDPLRGVLVMFFITTFSEITWRHPELSRWFHRLMIGFTKTWRTVWSSSSSSYSNIGLHFDSYSLWKFTSIIRWL